jgi:hypothetical protein
MPQCDASSQLSQKITRVVFASKNAPPANIFYLHHRRIPIFGAQLALLKPAASGFQRCCHQDSHQFFS